MTGEVILITPAQLKTLLIEAVSVALKHHQPYGPAEPTADRWLSLEELCNYLPGKPASATIYAKVQRREIPYKKMGKRLVFLQSEIDQWLHNQRRKTKAEVNAEVGQFLSIQRGGR